MGVSRPPRWVVFAQFCFLDGLAQLAAVRRRAVVVVARLVGGSSCSAASGGGLLAGGERWIKEGTAGVDTKKESV